MMAPTLRRVCLTLGLGCALAAAAQPSDAPVLFDVQRVADTLTIVARGRPGTTAASVADTLTAQLSKRCPKAEPLGALQLGAIQLGEYPFIDDAVIPAAPKGALFFPLRRFQLIQSAPMASLRVRCQDEVALAAIAVAAPAPIRLAVVSRLDESITYADQGAMSASHRLLKVPLKGQPHAQVLMAAALQALADRGVSAMAVAATDPHDLRLVVGPAPVPGEGFLGPILLTKLGTLGITKLSVLYNSLGLHWLRNRPVKLVGEAYISTFEGMPNIYENWDQDMANGPPESLHAKTTLQVQAALSQAVKASFHAMTPELLQRLLAP